jgi:hypothetical protein
MPQQGEARQTAATYQRWQTAIAVALDPSDRGDGGTGLPEFGLPLEGMGQLQDAEIILMPPHDLQPYR